MKNSVVFLLTILFSLGIIGLALSVYGTAKPLEKQSFKAVTFTDQAGTFSKRCAREIVPCAVDQDCQAICKEQQDGLDMACISISDPDDKSGTLPKKKVCALREAEIKCGKNLGGVLTWSGWSNPDRMEWNCLCQFPSYASNKNCTEFNAGICSAYDTEKSKIQSGFVWNVSMGRPELGYCNCPSGTIRQTVLSNQMQRCVSEKITGLYKDLSDSYGFTYVGCYEGVSDPSFLSLNQTKIESINGINGAKEKFLASTKPFHYFAISEDQMIPFTLFGNITLSTSEECAKTCVDEDQLKCGSKSGSKRVWQVYKKN